MRFGKNIIGYCATTLEVVCEEFYELIFDHEEAGTKVLLHAIHAAQTRTNIVMKSLDTTVAYVLCIQHSTYPCF